MRVRIDGRDAFINRLGRWSDPVAVAKAHAIAAQIWSDYCQGTFDRSLMAYQPLINGKEVGLLDALRVRAETKRQAAAIHAYRLLQRYGKPIRNRSDAEGFLGWLRAPPLPAKLTPLHFDHQGGLMEQSYASLQRGRQG